MKRTFCHFQCSTIYCNKCSLIHSFIDFWKWAS
jgi:hypothetical protein